MELPAKPPAYAVKVFRNPFKNGSGTIQGAANGAAARERYC